VTLLTYLLLIAAGGVMSLLAVGFEARRELLRLPVTDPSDRMAILVISSIFGTVLGGIGGAIAASGGGLVPAACLVLATTAVVFVVYRVVNFARWLNKSIDEHPLSDRGNRG
jgi:hypothetical protein